MTRLRSVFEKRSAVTLGQGASVLTAGRCRRGAVRADHLFKMVFAVAGDSAAYQRFGSVIGDGEMQLPLELSAINETPPG